MADADHTQGSPTLTGALKNTREYRSRSRSDSRSRSRERSPYSGRRGRYEESPRLGRRERSDRHSAHEEIIQTLLQQQYLQAQRIEQLIHNQMPAHNQAPMQVPAYSADPVMPVLTPMTTLGPTEPMEEGYSSPAAAPSKEAPGRQRSPEISTTASAPPEEADTVTQVIREYSRADRIDMVLEVLEEEETPSLLADNRNFIRALGKGYKVYKDTPPMLPAAPGLMKAFQPFHKELSAAPTSLRAKPTTSDSHPSGPYDVGYLPKYSEKTGRPAISNYAVAGRPWQTRAIPCTAAMTDKRISKGNLPKPEVPLSRLQSWEGSAREALDILSHTDYHLSASGELFKTIYENIEVAVVRPTEAAAAPPTDEATPPGEGEGEETKGVPSDAQNTLWNHAVTGLNMNYAAAYAIQDLAKILGWLISEMTVLRRDQVLKTYEGRLSTETILRLRCSDVNAPTFFDSAIFAEAQKEARTLADEKARDDMTKATIKALSTVAKERPFTREPHKKTGGKNPGAASSSGSNTGGNRNNNQSGGNNGGGNNNNRRTNDNRNHGNNNSNQKGNQSGNQDDNGNNYNQSSRQTDRGYQNNRGRGSNAGGRAPGKSSFRTKGANNQNGRHQQGGGGGGRY